MNKAKNRIVVCNMGTIILLPILLFFLIFTTTQADAHPGRTAADGCHYCRTNCNSWGGTTYGQRHCHRSKGVPQPYEPIRSHRDGTFEAWDPYRTPRYNNQSTGVDITGINNRFTRTLSIGSVGEDVRHLQRHLNTKGFIVSRAGPGSIGNETHYFGWKTKQALTQYQNFYWTAILKPIGLFYGTGYFGPMTIRHMNR